MAKRTKRRNNKLSKRKYSRRRVSRKRYSNGRVHRKKYRYSKRKTHKPKKLLVGGSEGQELYMPEYIKTHKRGDLVNSYNVIFYENGVETPKILEITYDWTIRGELSNKFRLLETLIRHGRQVFVHSDYMPLRSDIHDWILMTAVEGDNVVFYLRPRDITLDMYEGTKIVKKFMRASVPGKFELPLKFYLDPKEDDLEKKNNNLFKNLLECGANPLRHRFTYSGARNKSNNHNYSIKDQIIINNAYLEQTPVVISVPGQGEYDISFDSFDEVTGVIGKQVQKQNGNTRPIKISPGEPEFPQILSMSQEPISEEPCHQHEERNELKEKGRFKLQNGVDIVISGGSVTDFGAGKEWSPNTIAIVNAANMGGLGGGGVDGVITNMGGPFLALDRYSLPELKEGGRIITGGAEATGPRCYGMLHAGYVIHAVGPDYRDISIPDGNILLEQAYINSMRVAGRNNIEYIGFSLLSSGIFRGNPPKISLGEVLKIGIDTVKDNTYEGLLEVHFVAFSQEEEETLISLLQGNTSIIHINNSGEIIKQIMDQKYSFDEPIYKDDKELILIKGLFSQETGFILSAQLKHIKPESVISIQVAGNSLLPGGKYQMVTRDGTLDLEQIDIIPKHHTTQEESIIDSLLHASIIGGNNKEQLSQVFENMIGKNANLTPSIGQRIRHRIYPPETEVVIQSVNGDEGVQATKGMPWGCSNPGGGVDDTMSIQGIDFTEAIPEGDDDDDLMDYASKYNFAYTLDNVSMALSAGYYLRNGVGKTSDSTFKTDVVFCYGPNVYAESISDSGTMSRSKIKDYVEDDHHQKYFRECVKMSYRATLTSMVENGVDYPILCYVSGGIYSGQREGKATNTFIRVQIPHIIDEINKELGKPFDNIFLCG